MELSPSLALYGSILILIWAGYFLLKKRGEAHSIAIKTAAVEAGLIEPASLHPAIDPALCIGCGACARACPEGNTLGVIGGKAELIEPTNCIGHGACAAACPTYAITLVFGTARRGVDLPQVGPDFQTNVPGLFIAGELGGMGLIRNAVEQGRQAVDAIRKLDGLGTAGQLDLAIIGSGPAGLAAALAAKSHKLNYLVFEQDDLGGTVFKYPRGKIVTTAPVVLPIVGQVNFRETTKEALLSLWRQIETSQRLRVRYRERIDRIEKTATGFVVHSTRGIARCRSVLLAIGRRGTPRTLGVPGEESPKVVYQLIDAEQYRGQYVLVVGGGDSALEAAASLAQQPGTAVTISYRGDALWRVKPKNRERVEHLLKQGRLRIMLSSRVRRILNDAVEIEWNGSHKTIRNDAVIVCAGGIMPTDFLKSAGVAMETKFGTA